MSDVFVGDNDHGDTPLPPLSDLLWAEVTKLRQDKVRLEEDMNKLRKESKDIIENLVIYILETNETTKINTPPHECEFITEPEHGKCSFCETWGSAMMLVYPNQIEEENTNV